MEDLDRDTPSRKGAEGVALGRAGEVVAAKAEAGEAGGVGVEEEDEIAASDNVRKTQAGQQRPTSIPASRVRCGGKRISSRTRGHVAVAAATTATHGASVVAAATKNDIQVGGVVVVG